MMDVTKSSRVVIFALLCILPNLFGQENIVPDVSIRPLKPRGVIVSIKDTWMMNYFELQGNVNKRLEFGEVGDISIAVPKSKNGYWTARDDNVALKVGDIIYYYIHIGVKRRKGYDKTNLMYVVKELFDSEEELQSSQTPSSIPKSININPVPSVTTVAPSSCAKTVTEVIMRSSNSMKVICSGQIIFEDDFNGLSEDIWTTEQYIPSKPEYPFVSYQRPTVSIDNGVLQIKPKLQEKFPGYDSTAIKTSKLDLSVGCTRDGSCKYESSGPLILHPIGSGRITSHKTFAFKYGFIEVRAKVPQGDWLYPDILLEPMSQSNRAMENKVLRIAGARGNLKLRNGTEEFGNKVLYAGPMVDTNCRNNLLAKKISTAEWGNDFHVYSLIWAPEMITLMVDGEEWAKIKSTASDLESKLPADSCEQLRSILQSSLAPFNDFLGITLGVSAGGIMEFMDNIITGENIPKPWKNSESKGRLNFYNALNVWYPTWIQPALLVDYVRVRAL